MKEFFKNLGLVVAILAISFFLGEPVARLYHSISPGWGGLVAFLGGYFITMYFLAGVLCGFEFREWYRKMPLNIFILLLGMFVLLNLWGSVLLVVVYIFGYLLGFLLNKLHQHLRAYMPK
jgi:uncharacterized membrane protein